jgi:hypothetical protein
MVHSQRCSVFRPASSLRVKIIGGVVSASAREPQGPLNRREGQVHCNCMRDKMRSFTRPDHTPTERRGEGGPPQPRSSAPRSETRAAPRDHDPRTMIGVAPWIEWTHSRWEGASARANLLKSLKKHMILLSPIRNELLKLVLAARAPVSSFFYKI